MADVHSVATRRYNMSRVRSKDTKPELLVRKWLHANGFRYRLHHAELAAKPDITLPKYKTVIFIHGCLWHGHHECKYAALPVQNHEFWANKIGKNIDRDDRQLTALREAGWHVIVIWTCSLKPKKREHTLKQLVSDLNQIRSRPTLIKTKPILEKSDQ